MLRPVGHEAQEYDLLFIAFFPIKLSLNGERNSRLACDIHRRRNFGDSSAVFLGFGGI